MVGEKGSEMVGEKGSEMVGEKGSERVGRTRRRIDKDGKSAIGRYREER